MQIVLRTKYQDEFLIFFMSYYLLKGMKKNQKTAWIHIFLVILHR